MINIYITRDKDQAIQQIELTGHAGYADHGYDIVCAAVSSQVISVENSLEQLLNISVNAEVDEANGGYLKMTLPSLSDAQAEHAQFLLSHLQLALSVIAEHYSEFVKIHEKQLK